MRIFTLFVLIITFQTLFAQSPSQISPSDFSTGTDLNANFEWSDNTGLAPNYSLEVWNCTPAVDNYELGNYRAEIFTNALGSEELSGITYCKNSNTLFAVSDNLALYEMTLNGVVIRTINLINFEDNEGIVFLYDQTFAIVEERAWQVVFAEITPTTTSLDRNALSRVNLSGNGIVTGNNNGMEGISYDPETNKMFIVEETNPNPRMFEFNLPSSLSGNLSPSIVMENPLLADDYAGLHFLGTTNGSDCRNSSDHFLLLSHESQMVYEVDRNGNLFSSLDLGPNGANNTLSSSGISQAEGVTMDDDGNIYVLGEDNEFYKFSNPNPSDPNLLGTFSTYQVNVDNVSEFTAPNGVLDPSATYCWRIRNENAPLNVWSDFTSFCTDNSRVLPLELIEFSATLKEDKVELVWQTLAEFDMAHFTLEHSIDGLDFHELKQVDPKGQNNNLETYVTYDNSPSTGVNYYRLKSHNIDGSYDVSEIRSVMFQLGGELFSIFPNPLHGVQAFNLSIKGFMPDQPIHINIYNQLGEIIIIDRILTSNPSQIVKKSYSDLSNGFYLLTLQQGDLISTKKLVVF